MLLISKHSRVPFASAFLIALSSTVFYVPHAAAQQAAGGELPTVDVVATTPLGADTSTLNVPSETQTLTSQQIGNLQQPTLQDALARRTPGVSVTDEIGSPLSQSVDFRGETATPVPGTPEGLAVYMNGVRINESYGDVVNWDLIPPSAISTAQIVTGNPVFGLNALAGAVVMQMKNGFNWQGTEIDLQGGMQLYRAGLCCNMASIKAIGPITSTSTAYVPTAIAISANRTPSALTATSAIAPGTTKSI